MPTKPNSTKRASRTKARAPGRQVAERCAGQHGLTTQELADFAERSDDGTEPLIVLDDVPPTPESRFVGTLTGDQQLYLPDDFWQARPVLRHIQRAALARSTSPDAVLQNVLARIAAFGEPNLVLPPIVGTQVALNHLVAVISRAGGGKSAADGVASDLLPMPSYAILRTAGSGQSIAAAYYGWEAVSGSKKLSYVRVRDHAFMYIDEGETMMTLARQQESIFMSTLRAVWMGKDPGTSGVKVETTRHLEPLSYRFGGVVNFQPHIASGLLADANGGTPQRFIWVVARPQRRAGGRATRPDWPGSLSWKRHASGLVVPNQTQEQLLLAAKEEQVLQDVKVPEWIQDRIVEAHESEEDTPLLEQHALLLREKVAGLLAQLDDNRVEITGEDWQLAGQVLDCSRVVRRWTSHEVAQHEHLVEEEANARANRRADSRARNEAERPMRIKAAAARLVVAVAEAGGRLKWTGRDGYLNQQAGRVRDIAKAAVIEAIKDEHLVSEVKDQEQWLLPGPNMNA